MSLIDGVMATERGPGDVENDLGVVIGEIEELEEDLAKLKREKETLIDELGNYDSGDW